MNCAAGAGFSKMYIADQEKKIGTDLVSQVCAYLRQYGFWRVQLGWKREK